MTGSGQGALPVPESIVDPDLIGTYSGRMNDPSGSSYVKGVCGDQMEFYIVVEKDIITGIRFHAEGCAYTDACGAMACKLAANKPLAAALGISAGQVVAELKKIPESHIHCAILAVSALYRAIADYLLKP